MTTNPRKEVIYWGLFASPYLQTDIDLQGQFPTRHYEVMAVTSFSQTRSGTKMAHGHSIGEKSRSVHRQVQGMRFYSTRERMEQALRNAKLHDIEAVGMLREASRVYSMAQKNQRLAHEGILNKHEVQPRELED